MKRTKPPGDLPDGIAIERPSLFTFLDALSVPADSGPWKESLDLPERSKYYGLTDDSAYFMSYLHMGNTDDPTPGTEWQHLLEFRDDFETWYLQIKQNDLLAAQFDKVKLVMVEFQE